MRLNRRNFLTRFVLTGVGLAATGLGAHIVGAQETTCTRVSGAGSYALGPFEPLNEGEDFVPLYTDVGFDETMLFCKVTTNFAAFRMPTARLGIVELGAHEFYMDMRSVSIESLDIVEGPVGPVANFAGVLRSETRIFSGDRMRTYIEDHVSFGCEAINLSPAARVQIYAPNFSMTARFNPTGEHAAIFGTQATFAGRLTHGNIIIIP